MKLEEASTEIFSTLDEFGKLKIFETSSDIIEYFVNFRLTYYHKRKAFMLNKMQHELKILSNRGRFIKAILDEKLKEDFTAKKLDIKKLEETDPKDMYLDDLNELKKKFK